QYQYDARRQQGDGGGVFEDSQFTSTLSVNFHFPKIPRRTFFYFPSCAQRALGWGRGMIHCKVIEQKIKKS
ncbi:hypothetical protein ACEUAO_20810, partial [Aeromonas caviae]|uniref:hypothetical protein n=1 Tax=Aeromonas caviae TaxID=648 RepID=UPI0038D1127C